MKLKKMLLAFSLLALTATVLTGCNASSPRLGDEEEEKEVVDYSKMSVDEINKHRKELYKYDFIDFVEYGFSGANKIGYVDKINLKEFSQEDFKDEKEYIEIKKVLKDAKISVSKSSELSNEEIIELSIDTSGRSSSLINLDDYPLRVSGLEKGDSLDFNKISYNIYLLESIEQAKEKYKKNDSYYMDVASVVSLENSDITLEQAGSVYVYSSLDDSILKYKSSILKTSYGVGLDYLKDNGVHISGVTDQNGFDACSLNILTTNVCGVSTENVIKDKIKIAKKPQFNFVNKNDFEKVMLSYINQSFDSIYSQTKSLKEKNISFSEFDDVVSVWKYNTNNEQSIQKFQYAILVSGTSANGEKGYFLVQCGLLQDGDYIMPFQIKGKIDLKKLRDGLNEGEIMENTQNMYTFVTYC